MKGSKRRVAGATLAAGLSAWALVGGWRGEVEEAEEAEAQSCNQKCPESEKDKNGCCKPKPPPPKPPPSAKPPPPPPPPSAKPPPPKKDVQPAPTDCGEGMAGLPGGTYVQKEGTVEVKPFCLDLTEVTTSAYGACVKAGDCSAEGTREWDTCNAKGERGSHPMNCVDWKQANGFCKAQGKRLPSEAEWEWAARGGDAARKYPWGNEAPDEPEDRLCWSGGTEGKRSGTCAVGSFPTGHGRFGHKDLSGNVWEWTSSKFNAEEADRVTRGGGWLSRDPAWVSAASRIWNAPSLRGSDLGFRCAR